MFETHTLAALLAWCPPISSKDAAFLEGVAKDIAIVAEENPVFASEDGGRKTAILMASVVSLESSCRADVDSGAVKGDHGRAHGLMQVQLRPWERDLCDTRAGCLRIGRERLRESLHHCRGNAKDERLALYMSGSCRAGLRPARARWRRYASWRID